MPLSHTPSAWRRADVAPTAFTEPLGAEEREDLLRICAALGERPWRELTRADLPARGPIAAAAARWRRSLERGLGFVLVRGVPVDALTLEQLTTAYVVLGLHLGTPIPQNLRGELLTDVRDTGADPTLLSTRLYRTRAEQDFHTDGADIIGLLCRRTARVGGTSRIASSRAIVAEIERTRPDLFPVLFGTFPWHYQEEGTPALVLERPICVRPDGGDLNTFFIPWYIRRSQELPDAPRLTAAQEEVVALIERLANDPAFHLDMTFEPGDVQWLKNAAILHKRTEYEDHDEPDRKRHLLRLWLSAPDFTDGDAQLRAGITDGLAR